MIGALRPAELFPHRRVAGQPHQRTVHAQQPMSVPAAHQIRVRRPIHRMQHRLVEFDKRAGAKFGPRVGDRPGTQARHGQPLAQLPEKLLRVGLERLQTFLEQQQHEDGKGQHTRPREISGPPPMPAPERRSDERLPQLDDERQRPGLERRMVLHPQCTSRLYLLCTFKKYTTSSRFNGSAPRPSPRRGARFGIARK